MLEIHADRRTQTTQAALSASAKRTSVPAQQDFMLPTRLFTQEFKKSCVEWKTQGVSLGMTFCLTCSTRHALGKELQHSNSREGNLAGSACGFDLPLPPRPEHCQFQFLPPSVPKMRSLSIGACGCLCLCTGPFGARPTDWFLT